MARSGIGWVPGRCNYLCTSPYYEVRSAALEGEVHCQRGKFLELTARAAQREGDEMLFFFSLIPATVLVVIGYFVLFASTHAEGGVRTFGKFLAMWLLFLGAVVVLGGLLAPALGIRGPMAGMEEHMQRMEQHEEEQLRMLRELQQD